MGPNVVVVVLDAARRDAFEPYGAPVGSTPTVGQLASRGRALPEVYATAPWTVPSHASLFTGLLSRAAGLIHIPSPSAAKSALEPHASRFLPEVLRRHGYATVGASANPWASGLSGFDTGFDRFTLVDSERKASSHWRRQLGHARWLAEVGRGRVDDGARAAEGAFSTWLSAERQRPFFWFVNLVECHFPYLPPRPYGDVSTLDRLRAAEDVRRYFNLDSIYRVNARILEIPDDVLARARKLYRGAIRYMDDWLARLLERLDGAGVLEDTLIIVTADHGENFGEAGLVGHMLSLDQRLIHVPFVVAGPGAERVSLNSLADLPRRIADAVGLVDHPWGEGLPQGIGLAQSEPLGEADDPEVITALDKFGVVDEGGRARLTTKLSCAVRGDLKLVRRGEREELYRLDQDPLELDPLPVDRAPADLATRIGELRAALDHQAMAVVDPQGSAGERDTRPEASEAEMQDLEARMKLLGYM